MKQWLARASVACATVLATIIGASGTAYASDLWVYLYNPSNQMVATMRFIDDGDTFILTDWKANGHGPDGYLLRYIGGSWEYVKSVHNSKGAQNSVTFTYNITTSYVYKMKVCETGSGCKYSAEFTE